MPSGVLESKMVALKKSLYIRGHPCSRKCLTPEEGYDILMPKCYARAQPQMVASLAKHMMTSMGGLVP